jgi:beta-aspartyl-peptidase (threonine type)
VKPLLLAALLLFFANPAVHAAPPAPGKGSSTASVQSQISDWMSKLVEAMKQANIEAMGQFYWQSPQLITGANGSFLWGWKARQQSLAQEFGKVKQVDFRLEQLTIIPFEAKTVIVAASYVRDDVYEDRARHESGAWTLVLRRFDDGWKIVHEHSSD